MEDAIYGYIDSNDENPHAFVWTASAERMMTKVAKYKQELDVLHQVSYGMPEL